MHSITCTPKHQLNTHRDSDCKTPKTDLHGGDNLLSTGNILTLIDAIAMAQNTSLDFKILRGCSSSQRKKTRKKTSNLIKPPFDNCSIYNANVRDCVKTFFKPFKRQRVSQNLCLGFEVVVYKPLKSRNWTNGLHLLCFCPLHAQDY